MDHPAIPHLKKVDPVLGGVIDSIGRLPPAPRAEGTHLGAIARSIVHQQLSGQAAGTIHGRFEALYGGRAPTPAELLATPDEKLRAAGLSRAKAVYLKDLAARALAGLPVETLHDLDDAAVTESLTSVKGIGRWTAQMFLMFRLGRPDVLPDLDLGVRKAIQRVYGLRRLPTPQEVQARGAAWSPYASFAAWYLWQSLELPGSTSERPLRVRQTAKRRRPGASKAKRAKSAKSAKSAKRSSSGRKAGASAKRGAKGRGDSAGGARRTKPVRRARRGQKVSAAGKKSRTKRASVGGARRTKRSRDKGT